MIILFYFIFLSTLFYIFFKKRNVDIIAITLLGFYVYHAPYFIGNFGVSLPFLEGMVIDEYAYMYICSMALGLLLCMMKFDYSIKKNNTNTLNEIKNIKGDEVGLVLIISLVAYVASFLIYGFEQITNIKSGGKVGFLYGMSTWALMIVLSLSLLSKSKKIVFFVAFIIFLNMAIVGSRSIFLVSALMVIAIISGQYKINFYKWKFLFSIASLGFFLLIYKSIFKFVKNGDFSGVLSALTSAETYTASLHLLEPYIVSYHFVNAIDVGYEFNFSILVHRVFSLIPFLGDLLESLLGQDIPRYSSFIMDEYYSDVHYGLASNIWAESYYIGGPLFLYSMYLAWVFLIYKANKIFYQSESKLLYYITPAVFYTSFYIHRVDITFVLGAFKVCIMLFLLNYIIFSVLPKKT